MGEIKSVKVDNWGVFFLQKLQNFFNKTDYCDLTLQFRDNSQLKVHRLVLSACTDYFNVLEQTCDIVDDALIMPNELQADVVVPIVNFMYTGTLEFELKMYGKLLRTAKEMNMTVLLKLLEAHRRTMEGVSRAQRPPSPKGIRRRGPYTNNGNVPASQYQQSNAPNQRRATGQPAPQVPQPQPQRRVVQVNRSPGQQQSTGVQYRQQIGGVSIVKTSSSPIRAQYGNTTVYETQKEIKQEQMDYESHAQEPASPFEQLRKGYNNTKRPPTTSFVSPPAKKPNLEDVKEFAEQQRMRKAIAAEYGEDQEAYDNMLDDDIHNDDDDDDMGNSFSAPSTSTGRQQQQTHSDEGTTTITFKHESGDKPPTIVVKDSSNSKMNHAKIIQEVLRQYPHLVKSNRNIKLKILPSTSDRAQRIVIKKEAEDEAHAQQEQPVSRQQTATNTNTTTTTITQATAQSANATTMQQQRQISTQQQMTGNTNAVKAAASTPSTQNPQKRRIDSKTMHALIALGAENTTGPWLCLDCGVDGRPISIPSYRGFRRHLVNTHKKHIDPALCEHCGWRSQNDRNLHFHIQIEHKIKSSIYTFEECTLCAEQFEEPTALQDHMLNSHPDDNKQQCIYCNKIFAKEMELYNHMKTLHKVQAIEDGIIDETDEEFLGSQDEDDSQDMHTLQAIDAEKKVQILSDITLPVGGCTYLKQDPSPSEHSMQSTEVGENEHEQVMAEATTEVTPETKFVTADGSEVILTEEERKQIMSQLNQEVEGGSVVMFLNEPTAEAFPTESTSATDAASEEDVDVEDGETPSVSASNRAAAIAADDENSVGSKNDLDDSQIYEELNAQENAENDADMKNELSTSAGNIDESKESIENLEWAENLISAHDMEEETTAKTKVVAGQDKKQDDISKKLKELTGDWTDDENEEEMDDEEIGENKNELVEQEDEDEAIKNEHKLDELVEAAQNETDMDAVKLPNDEIVEDDIDLALKNLHKDDTNEVSEQEEQQKSETPTMHLDEAQTEEQSVDATEPKTETVLNAESEGLNELEATPESAAEFIKEEDLKGITEKKQKTDGVKKEKDAADAEPTAAEDNNDILLDDLMNEAVTGTTATSDVAEAQAEIDEEGEEEEEQIIREVVEEPAEKCSSKTAEDKKIAAVPTEKVKSLISEWVDDDDDEDEDEANEVEKVEAATAGGDSEKKK